MAWVAGIALGLLLLFAFPRQMVAVLGLLVLLGGGVLFLIFENDSRQRAAYAERLNSVKIQVSYDAARCAVEHPLLVQISNAHPRQQTLLSVRFELRGYREGFSKPVYRSLSNSSDKILRPGTAYEWCWPVPPLDYGAQPGAPQAMNWVAIVSSAHFGTPP